jgi:hypothetical protein
LIDNPHPYPDHVPSDGDCGVDIDKFGLVELHCTPGVCCSGTGHCNTDSCEIDCNPLFGDCPGAWNSGYTSDEGKCGLVGSELISCKAGFCCSSNGYCGLTTDYCGVGCQSDYGKCGGGIPPITNVPDYWPNCESYANSDDWIRHHHDDIKEIRPKVLVLNFANPTLGTQMCENLIDEIIKGFKHGSSWHNHGAPQLNYEIYKIVNLRDGDDDFPDACPAGYPYENSQQFPRRNPSVISTWGFDYNALFRDSFAVHYKVYDPDTSGWMGLAKLFKRGVINEVWVVGSSEVPSDVSIAEVLEFKQNYDEDNNKKDGDFNKCAGKGCFDQIDIPAVSEAGVSIRIAFINYKRGAGCGLVSAGHSMQHAAGTENCVPAWGKWFKGFAAMDLDVKYKLPFASLNDAPCPNGVCLDHVDKKHMKFHLSESEDVDVSSVDFVCGNVDFPPNGKSHGDCRRTSDTVSSSCANYGRGGADNDVDATLWQGFGDFSDCGGDFTIWWMSNMPWYGSEMQHDDGTLMKCPGPFMFY